MSCVQAASNCVCWHQVMVHLIRCVFENRNGDIFEPRNLSVDLELIDIRNGAFARLFHPELY